MPESRKHTTESLAALRKEFLRTPVFCAITMAAIHVIPKEPGDQEIRLIMTVAYFGAVLTLLVTSMAPREAYLQRLYEWRFEDAGPAMAQTWKMYLLSLNRLVRVLCYLGIALVASTALSTLAKWPLFSGLSAMEPVYYWGWWISLISIGLLPIFGGNLFSETFQRHRLLEEAIQTSDYRPREANELSRSAEQPAREAVERIADHEFYAGGFNWSWEDFYKNSVIFGMSGTGKTVCVLNALLDGFLCSTASSTHPPSGLILDPKGDFHSKIGVVCNRYGRARDVLVIDPYQLDRSIRWNPFDSDDDELEVAARFGAVLESTGMQAGGNDGFWIDSAKKFIRHAICLVRLTNPPGEPPSFQQINELAVSRDAIAARTDQLDIYDGRADQALVYFCNEWLKLADNTRTSILAYITNMIDPFLMEPYSTLFSGRSTMRISEMIDSGKILYIYMPIADKERMSRVICTFVKLEYYREVLKRPNKERSSFFLCDEFQAFFTVMPGKGDSDFFERSRQSNHANIIATQNYPALLKQANDKDSVVKNLLGNCSVKIFLRNTDDSTNRYASELFGQTLVTMAGSGIGAAAGKSVGGSSSASSSRQYDARVRTEEFVSLAVPSKRDGIDYTETIVHMAARGFVTKEKLRWKVHPLKG